MVVSADNLEDLSVPKLLEVGEDKVCCIFELSHLDIVLHLRVVYLSRQCV